MVYVWAVLLAGRLVFLTADSKVVAMVSGMVAATVFAAVVYLAVMMVSEWDYQLVEKWEHHSVHKLVDTMVT